ncbi:MAG: glycosyltransferase family 39 protein [Capsulimonas sp.]|uniref:ArnT family glycosyltransferase n=1 Tax=Capsulimonas sp. TaxID=2494211 RepID=UPI003262F466
MRIIGLADDPPMWLSWSSGIFTDEGFYTLDARHMALFGTLAPGNFHDRLLSPLLSLIQEAVFRTYGANVLTARGVSVAFSLLTLLVFWLGLRRSAGRPVADLGLLFLALATPYLLYNRLALQETPTAFWLVAAFAGWSYGESAEGRKRAVWFALAGASLGIAVVFKSLAGIAAPAILIACIWRPQASERRIGLWSLAGFALVIGMEALLWTIPHGSELRRMNAYFVSHQIMPHSPLSVWLNIRRALWNGERGLLPYLCAFLPSVIVLVAIAARRVRSRVSLFMWAWLGGGLLFCLLSNYAPSRYYVLFLPALCALAAIGARSIGRLPRVACVCVFIAVSGAWTVKQETERSATIFQMPSDIVRMVGVSSDIRLVGDFAPEICLHTKYSAAPVQPGLSNDDHPVERLNATYIAVTRAPKWRGWWIAHYPNLVTPKHFVGTVQFGGDGRYVIDIYRVH